MKANNWEVFIDRMPLGLATVRILVLRRAGPESVEFMAQKDGHFTQGIHKFKPGETGQPPAFLEIPISMMVEMDFFGLLAAALSAQGIKAPDRSRIEGELSATKEHLADMRKLVFGKVKQ